MESIQVAYVGGPLDDQVMPITCKDKPPILDARAFTEEGQQFVALYARFGEEGDFRYRYVNRYSLKEWQLRESDLATSLAATLLPWQSDASDAG